MLRLRATVFLGAFLLFAVQPIAARRLLPWFGGAPAVWTACLLFFQLLLLGGYAWAHWVAPRPWGKWMHRGLLAASLLFLPLALERPETLEPPTARILWLLLRSIGLPYLVLAATSPLVQRWAGGEAPYRLYAWANAAALSALLLYPFVFEPLLPVATQLLGWSAAYAVFVALAWWAARPAEPLLTLARPRPAALLGWALLAAGPAGLLLATTNQLCREIAATPFLWLLPLTLYLLSWILTFERERWCHRTGFAVLAGVAVPAAAGAAVAGLALPLWSHVAVDSLALLACAVSCHGELARSKPEASQLTGFYLAVAAGGALGGAWVGVAAPRLFLSYAEFPVTLAACAALVLLAWLRARWRPPLPALAALVTALLCPLATLADRPTGELLAARRNFYGILRVTQRAGDNGARRVLTHGRVMHGSQYVDWKKRSWPTTYYGRDTAAGQALDHHPRRPGPLRVGAVGLGVGTLAAYGQSGDLFRFYEINPAVVELARGYFTYLKDSAATVEVALGDARLVLEREPPQNFDVLLVDAFSSDAIPVHLLTAECADIYRRHLRTDALLLFHISNRSLDLWPVTRALAARLGWSARLVTTPGEEAKGTNRSAWVVLSAGGNPDLAPGSLLWTDDFSSLWRVLRFGP